jgi:hypothetical protein
LARAKAAEKSCIVSPSTSRGRLIEEQDFGIERLALVMSTPLIRTWPEDGF